MNLSYDELVAALDGLTVDGLTRLNRAVVSELRLKQNHAAVLASADFKVGDRVRILGDSKWRGRTGTIKEFLQKNARVDLDGARPETLRAPATMFEKIEAAA